MIVTRGFNSTNLVTRGYGITYIAEYIKAGCIFVKNAIGRVFSRNKQDVLFKKDC